MSLLTYKGKVVPKSTCKVLTSVALSLALLPKDLSLVAADNWFVISG